MNRCTECGTLSRQGIRRLRTDANAAPAVVTTALYQQLPEAMDETADQVGGAKTADVLRLPAGGRLRSAVPRTGPTRDCSNVATSRKRSATPLGEAATTGDLAILTRETRPGRRAPSPKLGHHRDSPSHQPVGLG